MRLIDADAIPKQIGISPTHDLEDWQYWVNFIAIDNAPTIEAIPQGFIEHMKKKYAEAECWMSYAILTELQNHWLRCQQEREQEDGITPSD